MFNGESKSNNSAKMYKLTHQLLSIVDFNFEKESIVGFVIMSITPLIPDLKTIYVNCQQCTLHRVSINDSMEPTYSYNDPTLDICQDHEHMRFNIENFETCHRNVLSEVNPDNGKGEICIAMPEELEESILELKPFQVIIEFSLAKPKGGLKFVVPDSDGTLLERGAHLFTYGHENSSRLWFPCIDSYSEVCTWKLEYTVSMYMTAVSCGDLVETIYSSDLRQKIYHYYLPVPTAAPNIALAVGPFEVWVDPNMHEVTNFCLPGLTAILKHTTSFVHEVFEFYEELLSTRYPYSCYKQVFIDMCYQDVIPYATMSICSVNLLHSVKIIEQTIETRKFLSNAIAQQFFGCYISMNSWNDAWLTKGLASLLSSLYQVKFFGHTNQVCNTALDMRKVCEYEINTRPIFLDPSKHPLKHLDCSHVLSPAYLDMYNLKAGLVTKMIEKHIGREFMLQVMNKLLVLASKAAQQKFIQPNSWSNMVISTASFIKCITLTTGKDVSSYFDQWVCNGGAVVLDGSYKFNKKRNVLELDLKQDLSSKNSTPYTGLISVVIQELDGSFSRQYMMEKGRMKFDISCHSKSRRQKKKKIPLWTGEEVEINLDETDADSPVLWVRIDPDMNLFRIVKLEQADFVWRNMLLYEKCVVAQIDAVKALERFPSDDTKKFLASAIENEKFFPKVKELAAFCLMKVENHKGRNSALIELFKKKFGSPSCPSIVRRNNFSNIQHYFLQKALVRAISELRNLNNICSSDTLRFILDLFKYNDNNKNKYSDGYYKATLVDALSNTVSQAITTVSLNWNQPSADLLTNDSKLIIEEIALCLNMEKIFSSYKFSVTSSCLKAIRRLQSLGHVPSESGLFKSYAVEGNFVDVRLAALESLVDYTAASESSDTLDWLLDLVENDVDLLLRYKIVEMLIANPPFKTADNKLNTEAFKNRLWDLINSGLSHDCRVRCAVVDLYKVLYTKPSKLYKEISSTKEKRSNIFSMEGTCSRDGSEFSFKRKAESPLERKDSFVKMDSWMDDSLEPPFKMGAYHSENSSEGDPYTPVENKDSPGSLRKVNKLWTSIYPQIKGSSLPQGISPDAPSTSYKTTKGEKFASGEDFEAIMHGDASGEMNLSELSCSSSSRGSSPKAGRSTKDYRSNDMSCYASQNMKHTLALSEEEDDDDDFENFTSSNNNMKSNTDDGSNFLLHKADDYDDVMNLSSDSEMGRSRQTSPDVDDDDIL